MFLALGTVFSATVIGVISEGSVFCDGNQCFLRWPQGEACSGGVGNGSAVFSAAVGVFCNG